MRRRTLLIFAALALVSIIGVVVTQVYWFRQAYNTNQEEFSKNTRIALKEVVKGILRYNNTHSIPSDPIEQISPSYYVVMVNDRIDAQVLEHYLQTELKRFNIKEGFEFSIYDCANQQMMYGEYSENDAVNTTVSINKQPQWKGDNYYFTVYFPHRASGVLGQMTPWLFSSAIVLVVVVFFTYSLFVILKQKRLSEIQRDFINNMAHEIRTPLSSIMVSAQTLRNPGITAHPQRLLSYATIILDEAGKLKNQLERVLSIAETENRIRLETEEVNLHKLLQRTAVHHIEQTPQKRIELDLDLGAIFFTMKGDPLHLANLFSNLIDNAIKYSHEQLLLNIVTQNKGHNSIEIRITDNGVGITKENQKKIFDKFYRAPTGNVHNVKGFGIGLSYVSLVTRMHKGSIKVESEPGKGASFILTFPLQ